MSEATRPTSAAEVRARKPQFKRRPDDKDPLDQLKEKLNSIPPEELRSLTPSEELDLKESIVTEAIEEVTVGNPNPSPRLGRLLAQRQGQTPRPSPVQTPPSPAHRSPWKRTHHKGSETSNLPIGSEEIELKREMRGVGLSKQQEEELINEMTPMGLTAKPERGAFRRRPPFAYSTGAISTSPNRSDEFETRQYRHLPDTTTPFIRYNKPQSNFRGPNQQRAKTPFRPTTAPIPPTPTVFEASAQQPDTTTPFIRYNKPPPNFRPPNQRALLGVTDYLAGTSQPLSPGSMRPASSPYPSNKPQTSSCPASGNSWVRQPIRMEDIQNPPPSKCPSMSPPMSPRQLLFMDPEARQAFVNQFPAASSNYVSDWGDLSSLSSEFVVSGREDDVTGWESIAPSCPGSQNVTGWDDLVQQSGLDNQDEAVWNDIFN